uniref:Uncharacterized protein n=1 Tax=viral metagenome TaxID=1070528 RepID=A0A6C0IBC8_9ZZZZ
MSNTIAAAAAAECTGVFCQEIYVSYAYRYNDPEYMRHRIGICGDYHLFIRSGDKVYMEVKKVGEIVMSFTELQKNKYWKYYYDLSLMLAIDKEIKNEPFNKFYDEAYEYTGNRKWSLDTAYIDLDIDQNAKSNYKIIPSGNVCYYKINPTDVEKMEYSTQQDIDIFKRIYMCRNDVRSGYFLSRSVIYRNIAIEYQVSKMEKELEELSAYFEDKEEVIELVSTLNDKYCMNEDILAIIINNFLY